MTALTRIRSLPVSLLISLAVGASLFAIAYDSGSYDVSSRNTLAIILWWVISTGAVLGLTALARMSPTAWAISGLILALSLWTLISLYWAPTAENAFNEFNRVALYLAVFLVVSLVVSHLTIDRWTNGLTIATTAIAIVALVSRLFPGSFPDRGLSTAMPGEALRLFFPLQYWNGLAIFVALGIPLLARLAIISRRPLARGLALAPLPIIASVIYLASSRVGIMTALVVAITFFGLSERRWSAAAAVIVASAGSGLAILVITNHRAIVDGPFSSSTARSQGIVAALLIALICAATGAVYGFGARLLGAVKLPRRLGQILVALVALLLIAGLIASHPIRRFDAFKKAPPSGMAQQTSGYVNSHLIMGSGNGRWQMWKGAFRQWEHYPLIGNGAGSFTEWWSEHPQVDGKIRDAHSLYLQTAGELGVVGFAILIALFGFVAIIAVRRSLGATGDRRVTMAALAAVFFGYAVAVTIDWMWELTAVTVFVFVVLALLAAAPEAEKNAIAQKEPSAFARALRGRGLKLTTVIAAWIFIGCQTVPLLAQLWIADSQSAVERGNAAAAEVAALNAHSVQPWGWSPDYQMALVKEQEVYQKGYLASASHWLEMAIDNDPNNWELWYDSFRLQLKQGHVKAALSDLHNAIQLNPGSRTMILIKTKLEGK